MYPHIQRLSTCVVLENTWYNLTVDLNTLLSRSLRPSHTTRSEIRNAHSEAGQRPRCNYTLKLAHDEHVLMEPCLRELKIEQ